MASTYVHNRIKLTKPYRSRKHKQANYYSNPQKINFSPSGRYLISLVHDSSGGFLVADLLRDEGSLYRRSRRTFQKFVECNGVNSFYWLDDSHFVGIFGQGLHLFRIDHEHKKVKCTLTKVFTSKRDVFHQLNSQRNIRLVHLEDHIIFYLDLSRNGANSDTTEPVLDKKSTRYVKILDNGSYDEVIMLMNKDPRSDEVPRITEVELREDFPDEIKMFVDGKFLFFVDPEVERRPKIICAINILCLARCQHSLYWPTWHRENMTYTTINAETTVIAPYNYNGPMTNESEERRISFKYLTLISCCSWEYLTGSDELAITQRAHRPPIRDDFANHHILDVDYVTSYRGDLIYRLRYPSPPILSHSIDPENSQNTTLVKTPRSLKTLAARRVLASPFLKGQLCSMRADGALFLK